MFKKGDSVVVLYSTNGNTSIPDYQFFETEVEEVYEEDAVDWRYENDEFIEVDCVAVKYKVKGNDGLIESIWVFPSKIEALAMANTRYADILERINKELRRINSKDFDSLKTYFITYSLPSEKSPIVKTEQVFIPKDECVEIYWNKYYNVSGIGTYLKHQ